MSAFIRVLLSAFNECFRIPKGIRNFLIPKDLISWNFTAQIRVFVLQIIHFDSRFYYRRLDVNTIIIFYSIAILQRDIFIDLY